MARQLKLVRLDDFISDIDSIDLFAGGYSLAEDGYTPMVAPLGATSVHEVITLKIQGSSKDNLATLVQAVDAKIKQVQWWLDDPGIERYQVWLRVQQDNETYARQAQVINVLPPEKIRVFQPEEYNNNYIGEYSIGIERTPFWEAPYTYPTTTTISTVRTLGNIIGTFAETINGDVPARLAQFSFDPDAGQFTSAWFGIKSSRFGDPANFVAQWFAVDYYSKSADSTVSGSELVCNFSSSATMTQRFSIRIADAAPAHPADQRGTYTVLLYAKVSDTSIIHGRMSYGYNVVNLAYNPTYRSRQTISGTSYTAYEMGTVSFPPIIIPPSYPLDDCIIGIELERISGSGSVTMFCLVLIPNESMIKVSSPSVANPLQTYPIEIYQKADGRLSAFWNKMSLSIQMQNWGLPAESGHAVVVYCGQYLGVTSPPLSEGSVTYTYIPRWRTLRGNVT